MLFDKILKSKKAAHCIHPIHIFGTHEAQFLDTGMLLWVTEFEGQAPQSQIYLLVEVY